MFNNFNKGFESQNQSQISTCQPQTHQVNSANANFFQTSSTLNQQSQSNHQNNANGNHSNFNFVGNTFFFKIALINLQSILIQLVVIVLLLLQLLGLLSQGLVIICVITDPCCFKSKL